MTAELILNETTCSWTPEDTYWYEAWLKVDGMVVSYAKIFDKPSYNGKICVCTIETREAFRRQGHSTTILNMVSESLGKPVATNASFTPEGFLALNKLPVLDGYDPAERPNWDSMNFVEDWDAMIGP